MPPRWRRSLYRHRHLLAAALVALAAILLVRQARPAPPATSAVVVTSHEIGPGSRLTPDDITVAAWPAGLVPPGALSTAAELPDRPLATALAAGEPVLTTRFVSPSLVRTYGSGLVAAPVRLADAGAAALLQAGDVVDVLAAEPAVAGDTLASPDARVVAAGVSVLLAPARARTADGPFGADLSAAADGALVVLATTPRTAAALAGAAATSRLSIVLRPA
jgi:Flp pilus assembly protein CpaB